MTEGARAEYGDLRFTPERIAILDAGAEVVVLPIASVRSLTLRRGFTAERPVLEAAMGFGCCALGVVAAWSGVSWLLGARYLSRSLFLLVLLFPLGYSLLRSALR